MMATIPYVNVLNNLKDFYEASRLKMVIDKKMVDDLRIQLETGESEDDKWVRLKQEEADQYKANIDYYNSERKKMLLWEQEARSNQRDRDARFWRREAARQRELEAADREAIMLFWLEYRKLVAKMNEESRPSKLNFGIL
ncbi:unnamed protein product [marine sediment metagenome]|uniref:Uncharacterized protein n=1 Tax=marine sediment metagenome TaxID=412755 RepID=X0VRQ6_9ZZZZ